VKKRDYRRRSLPHAGQFVDSPGEVWEFELTFIGDREPHKYQIYVSGLY